eukprot:346259_1
MTVKLRSASHDSTKQYMDYCTGDFLKATATLNVADTIATNREEVHRKCSGLPPVPNIPLPPPIQYRDNTQTMDVLTSSIGTMNMRNDSQTNDPRFIYNRNPIENEAFMRKESEMKMQELLRENEKLKEQMKSYDNRKQMNAGLQWKPNLNDEQWTHNVHNVYNPCGTPQMNNQMNHQTVNESRYNQSTNNQTQSRVNQGNGAWKQSQSGGGHQTVNESGYNQSTNNGWPQNQCNDAWNHCGQRTNNGGGYNGGGHGQQMNDIGMNHCGQQTNQSVNESGYNQGRNNGWNPDQSRVNQGNGARGWQQNQGNDAGGWKQRQSYNPRGYHDNQCGGGHAQQMNHGGYNGGGGQQTVNECEYNHGRNNGWNLGQSRVNQGNGARGWPQNQSGGQSGMSRGNGYGMVRKTNYANPNYNPY